MSDYTPVFNYITKVQQFYIDNTTLMQDPVLSFLVQKNMADIWSIESNIVKLNENIPPALFYPSLTIARSLVESSIKLIYLLFFENDRLQYQEDSKMLIFKNYFMVHKNIMENYFDIQKESGITVEDSHKGLQESFNNMCDSNKAVLLDVIKQSKFEITDDTLPKIDKFFINFKPLFMQIEDMYKALNDCKQLKLNEDERIKLRTLSYGFYNECSQFTHSIYPIAQPDLREPIRICWATFNLIVAALRAKYNVHISNELLQESFAVYDIMHPEDAGFLKSYRAHK